MVKYNQQQNKNTQEVRKKMFNLKKSLGSWKLRKNGKVIYKGTFLECMKIVIETSKN